MYTVKRRRTSLVQVGTSYTELKDKTTQIGSQGGSYKRKHPNTNHCTGYITYDELVRNYLFDKHETITWLQDIGLIAKAQQCRKCNGPMKLIEANDRSDGLKWECTRKTEGNRHYCEVSIRKDSFFSESNLSIEESLSSRTGGVIILHKVKSKHS